MSQVFSHLHDTVLLIVDLLFLSGIASSLCEQRQAQPKCFLARRRLQLAFMRGGDFLVNGPAQADATNPERTAGLAPIVDRQMREIQCPSRCHAAGDKLPCLSRTYKANIKMMALVNLIKNLRLDGLVSRPRSASA